MTFSISTLGVQLLTTNNLQNQQTALQNLNEQLASGQQHDNLTDYAPVDAHNLLNFQNGITQRNAYISGMQTVSTRLSIYDNTMNDMESLVSGAQTIASQNQTLDPSKVAQIQAQAQAYLKQIQDDLNQQVGGRYIYSGSRYSTPPVVDLTTLGAPTMPFVPATSPTLTDYDTEYNPPTTTTDAAAYAQDSVTVDDSFNVQYGVTSNDKGIQQVIAGLRLLNAGSSQSDPTVYKTDFANANTLLTTGLQNLQATHAGVAGNINIISQQTAVQNADITNLQNQISDIQQVNLTAVGTQINTLQTQLSASYSATASLIQESILKYLGT
jgi:flagellar hook-associated protein 3 FlgL